MMFFGYTFKPFNMRSIYSIHYFIDIKNFLMSQKNLLCFTQLQ